MFGKRVGADTARHEGNTVVPPRTASWIKRVPEEIPDDIILIGRREFLAKALAIVAGVTAVGDLALNSYEQKAEIDQTVATVRQRISSPRSHEKLNPGSLVPDDERTGTEFITGLVPDYNPMPGFSGYKYEGESVNSGFNQFVSTLEGGTKVSVLIPKGTTDECRKRLKWQFPEIAFEFLEVPVAKGGFNFVSNVIFTTGKKDAEGKPVMISSSADAMIFEEFAGARKLLNAIRRLFTPLYRSTLDSFADSDADIEAAGGLNLFGDEFVAEAYPKKFEQHYVPVVANKGDVKPTRLPNGKVGLIVGKRSLSETVQALRIKEGARIPMNEDQWREFDLIEPEYFENWMEKIRKLYQEHFGVEEVIFLDEPYIRDLMHRRKGKVQQSAMQGYEFFDSDMIVNTTTDKNGAAVAFCTKYVNRVDNHQDEAAYTSRIAHQLKTVAGYEIEFLPCGRYPALNYANSVIITKDDKKIARVPQYGIPEDEKAVAAFERRGIEVIKVDMSFVNKMTPEQKKTTGSVACAFEAVV